MMTMLLLTIILALALVLVVLMMAVLPTGSEFFSVFPMASGSIGGVVIVVASVVVAPAVSLSLSSFSRALSSGALRHRCVIGTVGGRIHA